MAENFEPRVIPYQTLVAPKGNKQLRALHSFLVGAECPKLPSLDYMCACSFEKRC